MNHRFAFVWILRLVFVVLLAISGIGKLLDGREAGQFLVALTNSHYLVEKWADDFIIGLSIFEIVLAGFLLYHRSVRLGLAILSGMLILFSITLVVVLVRDVSLSSCGCLGVFSDGMAIEIALLKNLFLLIAVIGCYWLLAITSSRSSLPTSLSKLPQ